MSNAAPTANAYDFSGSARSITRAIGFSPEASSDATRWSRLGLYAWRGYCERAEFEPFHEPVIVYHVGGAPKVAVQTSRERRQHTHPGRVTIIPPNTRIAWDIRGEVYSRTLHLQSPLFEPLVEAAGTATPELRFRCGIEDPMIALMVEALEKQLRSPSEKGFLHADEIADSLARHLLTTHGRLHIHPHAGGLSQKRVARCIDRLHASVTKGVSLQELADEAQLSRTYFADAFRRSTGHAPHQYLTRIRLEYARELLIHSSLPVVDVAFRCGFSSQAHLTTAFRKAFGKPPKRYRQEI